jgi:hypothetical protein
MGFNSAFKGLKIEELHDSSIKELRSQDMLFFNLIHHPGTTEYDQHEQGQRNGMQ